MNHESRPSSSHPIASVDVDATFRSMMVTTVAAAPPAPTVDDIVHPRVPLTAATGERSRPWVGAGVGLIAAAAAIGALVVIAQRDTPTNRDNPPANAPLPTNRLQGLPEHVLPSAAPDGWHLADIVEAPFSPGSSTHLGGQLFRRTSDGAAVVVYIEPAAGADAPDDTATATTVAVGAGQSADRAAVAFADGQARFTELGATVYVQRAGLSDDEARTFLSTLTASGWGAQLAYRSADPAWAQEASSVYAGPAQDRKPFGVLVYRSDEGDTVLVDLMQTAPGNEMWQFGVPEQRGDATLYIADSTISRRVGTLVASAVFDPKRARTDVRDAARSLMATLEPVADTAWTTAEDDLAARYSALPVAGDIERDGITITRHLDGIDDAICASAGTAPTRCHPTNQWGTATLDGLNVDVNLAGTWVHVAGLTTGQPDSAVAVTDKGDRITPAVGETTGGYLVAVVAPDSATTMKLSTRDPESSAETDAVRPIR